MSVSKAVIIPARLTATTAAPTLRRRKPPLALLTITARSMRAFISAVTLAAKTGDPRMMPSAPAILSRWELRASLACTHFRSWLM